MNLAGGGWECSARKIHSSGNPMTPFGGVKRSGIGVEFSVEGLKEYTTVQVLNVAR